MALAVPQALKKLLGLPVDPTTDETYASQSIPTPSTEPISSATPSVTRLFGPAINPKDQAAGEAADPTGATAAIKVPPSVSMPALKKAATPTPDESPTQATPNDPTDLAGLSSSKPTSDQLPTLAPQGSSHAVPAALLRFMGLTAETPKPGELYTGPVGTDAKLKAGVGFIGRLANAVATATGSPEEKKLAEQRSEFGPELQAKTDIAKAQIKSLGDYRQGELRNVSDRNDINQQKADQANQQAAGKMRARGYVPDEQSPGAYRPMTADEILADPVLSQKQDLAKAASVQKTAETALAQAHRDAIMNPANPVLAQKERQIQATLEMARANLGLRQHQLANSDQRLDLMKDRFGLAEGKAGAGIWQPALESGERLQIMRANLADGLKGNQQAMLSLLANHLGMTMGVQKGARLNQAIIAEAQNSQPWLQGMEARFDDRGYLTGVTLSPAQMEQMVGLGEQRYKTDVQKARYGAQFMGLDEEPQLPIDPNSGVAAPMPQALPQNTTRLPRRGTGAGNAAAPTAPPPTGVVNYTFPDGTVRPVRPDQIQRAESLGAKRQ